MRRQQLMNAIAWSFGPCFVAILAVSCATSQSRYSMLGQTFPPKPEGCEVQIFRDAAPDRPFARVSRLDVHLEKTYFVGSSLEGALPELKKQARLSGADAVIEIREIKSMVGETKIYHVTATGIRYTDAP
jgi:hypothetical protein